MDAYPIGYLGQIEFPAGGIEYPVHTEVRDPEVIDIDQRLTEVYGSDGWRIRGAMIEVLDRGAGATVRRWRQVHPNWLCNI